MANFVRDVPDIQTHTFINPGVVDKSKAIELGGISTAIQGALDLKDKVTVEQTKEELEEIEEKSQFFAQGKEAVLEEAGEALSQRDFNAVNVLDSQLRKLDRGEVTGVLSPTQVKTRKQLILKKAQNDTPWLVPEIRQLANTYIGSSGYSTASTGASPYEKAMEEMKIKEMQGFGSVAQQIEFAHYTARQQLEVARGVDSFPAMEKWAMSTASLVANNLSGQLRALYTADPRNFESSDYLQMIQNAKNEVRKLYFDKQIEAKKDGVSWTREQGNELEKLIEGEFAYVNGLAEAKDKDTYIKNTLKSLELAGIEDMMNFSPAFNALKNMYGPDVANQKMSVIVKYNDAIMRGANWEVIKEQIELGGKDSMDAMIFANVVKYRLAEMYPNLAKTMGEGGVYLNNKYLDMYKKGMAARFIGDPKLPEENKEPARIELSKSTNPGDFLAYKSSAVYAETITKPKAVEQVRTARNNLTVSLLNILKGSSTAETGEVFWNLQFDGTKFTRSDKKRETSGQPVEELLGVFGVEQKEVHDPNVNLLNEYLVISKKYGLDTEEWIQEVMTFMGEEVPKLTVPEEEDINKGTIEKENKITLDKEIVKKIKATDNLDEKRSLAIEAGIPEQLVDAIINRTEVEKLGAGTYMINGELIEVQ